MSTNDDLGPRVTAIEQHLGLEHGPPLDRLSGMEYRLDSLRDAVNHLGISQGEQQRLLVRLEAQGLEHGRGLVELRGGQTEIIRLLNLILGQQGNDDA